MSKLKKDKSKNISCGAKKTSIGGQALIEGIMMRGPKHSAMAVRNPEGEIVLEKWENKLSKKPKILKLPLFRGLFVFIDSMREGYKCLMRSAEIAGLDEEEPKKKNKSDADTELAADTLAEADAPDSAQGKEEKEEKSSSALFNVVMVIATVLGIALAVFLFILLPSYIFKWTAMLLPALSPENKIAASLIKSVFEGVLRIIIIVAYMLLVTLMKDIRRTFMYHGAEHKTIFCYEAGLELTVENVRKQKRFHPRCGTSFLILMLLVGILISFFIDPIFIATLGYVPPTIIRTLVKLALLPLTMGIGYELIKLAGRHQNLFTRIISAPGMWLQHVTVLEPTDDMIECAITAFAEVIPEDKSDSF